MACTKSKIETKKQHQKGQGNKTPEQHKQETISQIRVGIGLGRARRPKHNLLKNLRLKPDL